MTQQVGQLVKGEGATLMISATDHGCPSFSPTGRSEWRTGRKVVVGALAMTLGALALGLVSASRTQPAGAVRTDVLPAAPSPTPRPPAIRTEAARGYAIRQILTTRLDWKRQS